MQRIPPSIRAWAVPCLLLALLLTAVALLAQEGLPGKGDPAMFGGADRALAFVTTDKPMYRAGETVWGRVVVVDAHTLVPLQAKAAAVFEVVSPRGEKAFRQVSWAEGGVAAFAWKVPDGTAGGEYALKATFPQLGVAPARRTFDVRAYRAPRFRTQIVFAKKGYGPGEKVMATLKALQAEGGAPAGAVVTIQARVDGTEVFRVESKLGASGECTAQFDLPADIAEGEGSLTFVIRYGGVVESVAQTIPILLNRVMVQFYPEGGDLVGGLPCRVYLEASDQRRKPADVSGRILGPDGRAEADFSTAHEGRGAFAFTPKAGVLYTAVLDRPAGNTQRFVLPTVKASGCVLKSLVRVFDAGQPLRFSVASAAEGTFRLAVCRLEREAASASFALKPGDLRMVSLDLPAGVCGVLRATVFDDKGLPLAERLVFRRPPGGVKVEVRAVPENAVPGAPVSLEILTTGDDGKPVSALVGLAVTDDAVLEKVEKREQAPRLPEQVLLEGEVRELGDAHVYLARNDASESATDLLLGTQGWRRFAFLTPPEEFLKVHGDFGKRALAFRSPAEPLPFGDEQVEKEGRLRLEGAGPRAVAAAPGGPKGGRRPERGSKQRRGRSWKRLRTRRKTKKRSRTPKRKRATGPTRWVSSKRSGEGRP